MEPCILIGGSGAVGQAIAQALLDAGREVIVLDGRAPPGRMTAAGARWLEADLLTGDLPALPEGEAVLLLGLVASRPRWPWLLPMRNAIATARILPALTGRAVLLMSSAEIYGCACAPAKEDTPPVLPLAIDQIDEWCDDAIRLAREPCPPWRSAALGRRLAAADTPGRWAYALSKLAQERLVAREADAARLTILRLATICGTGQDCATTRLIRQALAGHPLRVPRTERSFVPIGELAGIAASGLPPGVYNVGGEPVSLPVLAAEIRDLCGSAARIEPSPPGAGDDGVVMDTSRLRAAGRRIGPLRPHLGAMVAAVRSDGSPAFEPVLPVVIPPRAARPDQVAARQQASLWRGEVKHGNRWSRELSTALEEVLGIGGEHTLLVTTSGTSALRLVIAATVGAAEPGDTAVLPSFTFPATAEVLLQLGYRLRFADVDEGTWTIHPEGLGAMLAAEPARVVVSVDTFGNPCDYAALARVCGGAGVPLIADSAASIGSRYQHRPVAGFARGHAYSMSFAKVLSAGGAGGAAVLPADAATALLSDQHGWWRSELMDELHAICALDQLDMLDDLVRRRNRVADVYRAGLPQLTPQQVRPGDTHSYVHWVARVPRIPGREVLQRALGDCGVQTKPYFRALHLAGFGGGGPLPVTERLDGEVLALPMSSELTEEDAEQVVIAVEHCLAALACGMPGRS
jgi:dTDP-4-amino-4,6-dideoxygalactose transaminase/nucleoside-diphosphate-sugar epimerase